MAELEGLDTVLQNLNKAITDMKTGSLKGLVRAALLIRRDMDTTSPVIPVDTGNLRASAFIIASTGETTQGMAPAFDGKDKGKMMGNHFAVMSKTFTAIHGESPQVAIGFTAFYAWYVHENIGAHFNRAGAGAKFFQAALSRNKQQILQLIAESAKVKK